jgi:hypothetical protein
MKLHSISTSSLHYAHTIQLMFKSNAFRTKTVSYLSWARPISKHEEEEQTRKGHDETLAVNIITVTEAIESMYENLKKCDLPNKAAVVPLSIPPQLWSSYVLLD